MVWRKWTGALLLAAASMQSAAPAADPASVALANPLLASGPDPWIVRDGRTYYFMSTLGDRLGIRATRDLAQLASAPETVVWRPPATGANARSIWAPELHRIDGKWYIYYTAAASGQDDDAHRGIFVLENTAADPLKGHWIDRGRLATARPGIDGTTFVDRGRRYFVYSPYVGDESDLVIVQMSNPWTLTGPETIIARPDRSWERQGGRRILEGPAFLRGPKGGAFLSYSGSACWSDDYAIGLLSLVPGGDPLDPAAWSKTPAPVLAQSPATGVYAPGHNGFFTAPDGSSWIVYHANTAPGLKCTARRAPFVQRIDFDRTDAPVFPAPSRQAPRP